MTEITESAASSAALPSIKMGVEAVEIEHEGKPMVLLRDQEGLSERAIAITPPGFLIAMMLNGRNTAQDIINHFAKATGAFLNPEEIRSLVAELDKAELLETETLQKKRQKVMDEFRASPTRKAIQVGGGYPAEPLELATFLGRFFQDPKGPGRTVSTPPAGSAPALGLLAPHIDLHRGGPAYAWAYQALGSLPKPDVIVALGVAHASPNSPWVLSRKSYGTPYGPVPCADDLFSDVQKALWYPGDADEWAHRTEHSLEFQALWLRYLWREETPPWLPILCSSFDRFAPDRPPSEIESIENAIQAMGSALKKRQESGQRVLILAGVDLAHVGPRFGDELELNKELEEKIQKEDQVSIDKALALDADGFYLSVVADDHWRKVCGLSAIYTAVRLLKILGASPGRQLTYGQAPDPLGGIVSFVSGIYEG